MTRAKLAGSHEVAELLGVSRQRVNQLADTPGFPKPIDEIAMGRIWRRSDVERYAAKRAAKK